MRRTTKKTTQNKVQKKSIVKKKSAKPVAARSSRGRRRATPVAPVLEVTPKGLLALSTEYGVFVAITTPFEVPLLSDFRLAAKDPFPRVISASAKRCRVSVGEWRDEKAGTVERMYVAFIPTPAGATVEGSVLYGAKLGRTPLFVTVPSQRYAAIDADKQKKLLYLLQPRLIEIANDCLPDDHALVKDLESVTLLRREQEAWTAVQERIRGHLERKDGRAALRELEPLVYVANPKAPAEKLLSEMLLRANQNDQSTQADSAQASLKAESLMLSYLLSRLRRQPEVKALPSPRE